MIRSLAFTTKGSLHTKDIDLFLMPTLLADTNLFLWIDLEAPTKEEVHTILESVFHFHPLSIVPEGALSCTDMSMAMPRSGCLGPCIACTCDAVSPVWYWNRSTV